MLPSPCTYTASCPHFTTCVVISLTKTVVAPLHQIEHYVHSQTIRYLLFN